MAFTQGEVLESGCKAFSTMVMWEFFQARKICEARVRNAHLPWKRRLIGDFFRIYFGFFAKIYFTYLFGNGVSIFSGDHPLYSFTDTESFILTVISSGFIKTFMKFLLLEITIYGIHDEAFDCFYRNNQIVRTLFATFYGYYSYVVYFEDIEDIPQFGIITTFFIIDISTWVNVAIVDLVEDFIVIKLGGDGKFGKKLNLEAFFANWFAYRALNVVTLGSKLWIAYGCGAFLETKGFSLIQLSRALGLLVLIVFMCDRVQKAFKEPGILHNISKYMPNLTNYSVDLRQGKKEKKVKEKKD